MGLLAHWFLLLGLLGILIVMVALAFGISVTLRSRRPPVLSPDRRGPILNLCPDDAA